MGREHVEPSFDVTLGQKLRQPKIDLLNFTLSEWTLKSQFHIISALQSVDCKLFLCPSLVGHSRLRMARMNEEMRDSEAVFGATGESMKLLTFSFEIRSAASVRSLQEMTKPFRTFSETLAIWHHMTRRSWPDEDSAAKKTMRTRERVTYLVEFSFSVLIIT